jgi:hypothetical protein
VNTLFPTVEVVNVNDSEYDVYIGRGSLFGNNYVIGVHGSREEVIEQYTHEFLDRVRTDSQFHDAVMALTNNRIGCHCKPKPCHGDVIKKYIEGKLR